MYPAEKIKLFGLSNSLAERALDKIEQTLNVDLGRVTTDKKDDQYYPQFNQEHRAEAATMAEHYELFYCLERSIRQLIVERLQASHGENWWDNRVPESVRNSASLNMKREIESGITLRSENEIDFITFGELGDIVRSNWAAFDTVFSSEKAFSSIMNRLNQLRGPIAHCCPLAEDEIVRLQLTLRDWFRLME